MKHRLRLIKKPLNPLRWLILLVKGYSELP